MFKPFLPDESGAQVVEYALAIAVISILSIVVLQSLATGIGLSGLADLVEFVRTCFGDVDCG